MKSKKVTMLVAALAVAVVAAAGIGYAVTNYTATTTNTENSLDSTYITVTQSGPGSYATANFFKKLYFNTENETNAATIKYIPAYDYYIDDDDSTAKTVAPSGSKLNYELVSEVLTLHVTPTNSGVTSEKMTVNLNVTATEFTPVPGLKYYIAIVTPGEASSYTIEDYAEVTSAAYDSATGWAISGIEISSSSTTSSTLNVVMFIGGETNTALDGKAGFAGSDADDDHKTTFTFKITVPVA